MKTLSVIISAFNDHQATVVHVRECMNSTLMPDEIIVVNDHGAEDLKEMLQKLEIKTKLIYAYVKDDIKMNYTGARNLGVWLSRGDYISVEDNDHIPQKDFYKLAVEALEADKTANRAKTHKRWVVEREDVISKPLEEWKVIGSRVPHQDVSVFRRSTLLKIKGYDERFAGEYGWCATDIKRRLHRIEAKNINAGHQYVIQSPKTRGLSYRNYHLARNQMDFQSPHGILNFKYEYCEL